MARRRRVCVSARVTVVLRRIPAGRNDPPAPRREPPYTPPAVEFKKQLHVVQPSELTPPPALPLPPRATQLNPRFTAEVEPISRSFSRYEEQGRYEGGHKGKKARRLREKWGFSMGWGRGGHDPRGKSEVRRALEKYQRVLEEKREYARLMDAA